MNNKDIKVPQIKFEDTLEYQEHKASDQNPPELKDHLIYLDQIFMFCFGALQSLNSRRYGETSKQLRCQTMILMRRKNMGGALC